ncbi:hypothetical protein [Flavobacterium subsaxonicum]|uniref:Uncharacterized protein n=1 Tax=Flavobacterium subsaxonicum WB 4.1-42 = DSM 21790 TaxID=1121898 RepID=A0A0A2ML88_9FLAO|nr:hypothetical protein [Flavobacterium subsaxonicum]KGO92213.1 hypothetical protein Q766_13710 [Flavobacterium subsaxonicum WB 4.1-42 = DSM 21790]
MDWKNIKDKFYYIDNGKFRNIICYDLTLNDWEKWINFVNINYKVSFKSYQTQVVKDYIVLTDIKEYWEGLNEYGFMASIYIEDVQINCFFNDSSDLDNDIDAFEINKVEQHNTIVKYISNISKCLNKKVYLERDDFEDDDSKILIEVYNSDVVIN